MAQLGVVGFDAVGLTFTGGDFVLRFAGIDEVSVNGKAIAKVAQGVLAFVYHRLKRVPIGRERDRKREEATCLPVDKGHEIAPFFLEPTNVHSSSSSAVSTVSGSGGVVPCVCKAAL